MFHKTYGTKMNNNKRCLHTEKVKKYKLHHTKLSSYPSLLFFSLRFRNTNNIYDASKQRNKETESNEINDKENNVDIPSIASYSKYNNCILASMSVLTERSSLRRGRGWSKS